MPTLKEALAATPWRDITGPVIPSTGSLTAPALEAFEVGGTIKDYCFTDTPQSDVVDNITYHIDHGIITDEDIYLHPHWGHNGTGITGDLVIDWYLTYLPRDGAQVPEINITQTIATAGKPQTGNYCNVDDFLIANENGTDGLFDRAIFEIDGLLKVAIKLTTLPTITGGTPSKVFIFLADMHLKSLNIGSELKDTPYNN